MEVSGWQPAIHKHESPIANLHVTAPSSDTTQITHEAGWRSRRAK
jgi:hypothetical protein